MTKRALIAEPDQEEALRQAAILKDDGYEALVFTGPDLVAAVEQSPPDVLVLRHERPGSQTGLALVPRLKSAAPGTSIVLTTSDLTPDAIDKNKKQKVHADWYLRLPADRGELVGAARAVPQVSDADNVTVETEDGKARDPSRPPPLPPAGLRALGQLPKASPRGTGDAVLTAEDLTFVEKVFSSIQHIDADAPINDPIPSAIGDIPDRKLALLRTKLKERERDLAKLSRLWRAREEDLRQQEARVQQKDIEIEGLRLRIAELTSELEIAHATLEEKEGEWGRQIGETYEQHSLNEAELIQQVAGKESEVNRLKTTLRKLEDAGAAERKDFTGRILEWEKAYATFEQHHWQIIMASLEEVQRLEGQIHERDTIRKELRGALRDRDLTIGLLNTRLDEERRHRFSVENEALLTEQRAAVAVQSALALAGRERQALADDYVGYRESVDGVEEDLQRHQWALDQVLRDHRAHVAELANVIRQAEAEEIRLVDEGQHHRRRADALESALSTATALGEAVAATLFALDDKKTIILREQTRVRDELIAEIRDDNERLQTNLTGVTERLGQEEMDHAAEHARAEELERELAELRERSATTETRLEGALEGMTGERDRLSDKLSTTEQQLSTTREELSEAKHSRQQRELEVANLIERKENELADRTQRIADLERSIADAKEDIANLRKTVSTRDDRITELLNRVREADEKQVQQEGQIFRLESSNSEREATILSRDERIAQITDKLTQRETEIDELEESLKQSQHVAGDRQAQIERLDGNIAELQRQLSTSKEETTGVKAELQTRSNELFESERTASSLQADLKNARAEIVAGAAVVEQLQENLTSAEARGADLRSILDETDTKLRGALADLDAAGERSDGLRKDLSNAKEEIQRHQAEIAQKQSALVEMERARDQVQANFNASREMLEAQLKESAGEKTELEEQLAQQVGENGALSASLTDAATRIEELQGRVRSLENTMSDREGRISAQEQVLEKAEQTTADLQRQLAERTNDLEENRQSLEEAKSAIEERAKWLQTREATIAELKAALDAEKAHAIEASKQSESVGGELNTLRQTAEGLRKDLAARDTALQATKASLGEEKRVTEGKLNELTSQISRLQAELESKASALQAGDAAAAQLKEAQKSEAHVRGEYQKLRSQAEKIVGDNKQLKALLEKGEADRKAASADVERLSAELQVVKASANAGAGAAQQAKADADARSKEIAELRAQAQRQTQQLAAAQKAKADADAQLERFRKDSETAKAAAVEAQAADVTRLQKELLDARKAQRDAVAQAQQAKAEAEQIKKNAAQRLAARSSAPRPVTEAPKPAPAAVSTAPKAAGGLSPPKGASQEGNPFDTPTVAVDAPGGNPFDPQRTVMVDKPTIPSQARGPTSKG